MAAILGIGGIFFKSQDPAQLADWYRRVFDLAFADWGGIAFPITPAAAQPGACQVFSAFPAATTYFAPSEKPFMINLMVDDLDGVLARAAHAGVEPVWRDDADPNGRFAHVIDPEGTKIELWEPKATA